MSDRPVTQLPRPVIHKYQDGMRAPDPFIDPAAAGGFGGGRHQKSASKFVYRGGFKIPKELTPMPSVESFMAELGGSTSSNVGSQGGFERDTNDSRENSAVGGGSGSKLRDRGRSTKRTGGGGGGGDPGSQSGLEGIISSSRMRVGSSSERVAMEGGARRGGGGGRDGIKMPRPKTASATIGRGESTFSASSAAGGFNRKRQAYVLRENSSFRLGWDS